MKEHVAGYETNTAWAAHMPLNKVTLAYLYSLW
jgi:hypothetical protein